MSVQHENSLLALCRAAMEPQAFVAISIAPGALRALSRRFELEAVPSEQEIALRLKSLGVGRVFFDDGLAQAQTAMEAAALIRRMETREKLPLLLSSCPSRFEQTASKKTGLDSLVSVAPPDARCRGLAIRSLLSAQHCLPFSSIIHVTVVSCAAQQARYLRHNADTRLCIDGDYVITVRDLLLWLGLTGGLPLPMGGGEPSATASFHGRLREVLSQAFYQQSGIRPPLSNFSLRPSITHSALWEGEVLFMGHSLRYAQLWGLHNAPWLLEKLQTGELRYDLLEVFTCMHCG